MSKPFPPPQRQAILNPAFSSTLTCPPSSFSSPPPLIATVRAMCRICSNISNPARGLVLSGSFNCFPAKLRPILDNCLYQSARKRVTDLEECRTVKDSTNAHIEAEFNYTVSSGDQKSLQFLAMAFRTVSCIYHVQYVYCVVRVAGFVTIFSFLPFPPFFLLSLPLSPTPLPPPLSDH